MTFFFISHKNVQVGFGSVDCSSGSVIQKYRSADPDSVGNNYGSGTLILETYIATV
jgi:hypothetical protein